MSKYRRSTGFGSKQFKGSLGELFHLDPTSNENSIDYSKKSLSGDKDNFGFYVFGAITMLFMAILAVILAAQNNLTR
jgi:hypothetical protein